MIHKFKHIFLFLITTVVMLNAQQPQHFTYNTNTGNNAIVSIPSSVNPKANNSSLSAGDEIGVFTTSGLCVGAVVWTGDNIGITVWGDNDRTPAIDGMGYEEKMNFKIWRKADNKEYSSAVVTYNTTNPMYRFDGLYAPNAFYVVATMNATGAPFPPSLSYPANGTTSLPTAITFSWTIPEVTNSYNLQIARDTFFTQLVVNDTGIKVNSATINNLSKTSKYYWRVAAKNSIGVSDWSPIWSFSTITEVPDKPSLVYPANNSTAVPTTFVFSWNASARAESYDIEIAFDQSFNMMYKNEGGIKIPYYEISNLSNYVTYYWRIKAVNVGGYSQYSDIYSFTTIPLAPTAIFPANGQKGISVLPVLQWTSIPNASSYNVILTTNPADASATVLYKNNITSTALELLLPLLNDKIYYWKISANIGGGTTAWSETYNFKTKLAAPIPYTPVEWATGVPVSPKFEWSPVSNANYYHLQLVLSSGNFSTPLVDISNLTGTAYTIPTALKSLTQYQWRIAAINSDGESDWSTIQVFTTRLTAPDPPTLQSPSSNTVGQPLQPTLLWQSLGNGITYVLQVTKDISNWSNLVVNRSGITDNYYTIGFDLQYYTDYYWRVAATNSVGTGEFSTPSKFTTRITNPYLTSPQDGARAISITPTISWSAVSGATSYNLQISTSSTNWNSPVISRTGITGSSVDITTPLNYSTTYYARITANSLGGPSDWSAIISFTTAMASPELLSPNSGGYGISLTPTLAWSSVQNATSYQLQVSTSSDNWTSPVMDQAGITANLYSFTFTLQNFTSYYWRVRAINSSEVSGWSTIRNFTTRIASPNTTYPVDNSTWNDVIPQFVWGNVSGGTSYALQVSTNASDWTNPIINVETISGNTYLSPVQLANNTTYYWRVSANSAGGKSDWSTIKMFKTLPSYPSSVHLSASVTFPHYGSTSDYKASDYKLFGLPGASNISVSTIMSGEHKKNWNSYWDNGQSSNYMVEYDGTDIFKFSVGRAFWIISNSDIAVNQTVATSSLNAQQEIEIPLHPGWNIITNPFAANINWQKVQQKNNISDPIWSYSSKFETSSIFEQYKGYYFDNKNNLSYLRIPYSLTEASIAGNDENEKPQIEININLSSKDGDHGSVKIGISDKATENIDDMDYKKPAAPGLIDDLSINISGQKDNYATDYRKCINNCERWDISVRNRETGIKTLNLGNIKSIPEIYSVYLFDHVKNKKLNLRDDSLYCFTANKGNNNFSIFVGNADEIEKEVKAITKPDRFEIMQNYPNPFNPQTTIPVKVPNSGKIILAIYDILGKEVTKLHDGIIEAGTYNFNWNGKDKLGYIVPSGTYFVRMISIGNNLHETRKIMLLK